MFIKQNLQTLRLCMGEAYHEWHGDISQWKDVNSRQWRFVDGLSFLNHQERDFSTVHQILGISDRQCHCRLRHASEGLHQGIWRWSVGAVASVLSLVRLCNEFGYSYSWPSGEPPRLSKGKNVIECSIENFVPVVAVTKQKALPSFGFIDSQGTFWAITRSGGHHARSVTTIYRSIKGTRCICFISKS